MGKIWFTSDLHWGHDREFIYGPRGFKNTYEMTETSLKNWNSVVEDEDDVYVLGDLMLGDNEYGRKHIAQLRGRIHIILGNHDTVNRQEIYKNLHNVVEVTYAKQIKVKGWSLFLCHYPTMTSNLEKEFDKRCILNLFGHTHQKEKFYNGLPFCYHVGQDSHNCTPVDFETVISDIKTEVKKCQSYL